MNLPVNDIQNYFGIKIDDKKIIFVFFCGYMKIWIYKKMYKVSNFIFEKNFDFGSKYSDLT